MISQQHPTAPVLRPRLDGRAIAAVVFGALGLAVPFGPAIVAIVLAGRVERRLELHGGRQADRDLASVGAALGWCGLVTMALVVGFLVAMAIVGASFGSSDTTFTTTY